ncbi:acyltransferase family protein [Neobacillus sp. NPDC097160]|uniref:acyltransferase family protein n=1 Tax=Neobacillus sp. NPDC097160 TaxID=3364298 RepID=UPI00380A0589
MVQVLGHSFPTENISKIASWLNNFIYSFHMPLFMTMSGFLFIYSGGIKNNYSSFIQGKFNRLIIPYIVLSSVGFVPKSFLSQFAMRPIDLSFNVFIRNLFIPEENVIIFFWFLPTLFLIFLISPIFLKLLTEKSYIILFTLLLVLTNILNPFINISHFNLNDVAFYLIYFWIGYLLAKYYEFIKFIINKSYVLILSTCIMIVATFNQYDSSFYKLLIAVIGITMSLSFVNFLENYNTKILNYIDGYSYQIYLLSWFFQTFFMILIGNVFDINYWVTPLFMFLGGLILPVLTTKVVNAYLPKLNILIGMKYK